MPILNPKMRQPFASQINAFETSYRRLECMLFLDDINQVIS